MIKVSREDNDFNSNTSSTEIADTECKIGPCKLLKKKINDKINHVRKQQETIKKKQDLKQNQIEQ